MATRRAACPYGEGVTFGPCWRWSKAQAGILETDTAGRGRGQAPPRGGRLAWATEDEAAWVEAHLRPLVGLAAGAKAERRRGEEVFAAWRRFFESLAEQSPLVLVFEDLHWADEGLLDFVDHLVDWASGVPLLVVCTARPELLLQRPAGEAGPNARRSRLSQP